MQFQFEGLTPLGLTLLECAPGHLVSCTREQGLGITRKGLEPRSAPMAEPPPSGTGQQDKSYFKNSVAKDGKVRRPPPASSPPEEVSPRALLPELGRRSAGLTARGSGRRKRSRRP